jgi:hypothetical protein
MKIKKVVIVGGGSAGWMSAATMISQFPDIETTVIETPDVPTVGVGESTIGGINVWTNVVGIDKKDFMKHTDASYKMSIRFTDFYRKGAGSFHYPFGLPDTNNNIAELNDWTFKKILYPSTPVSDYADSVYPQMALVNQNKIDKNEDWKLPNFIFDRDTAFHFDATAFAIWLRDKFSKPKGVNHIQALVTDVITNDEGIDHIVLDNGDKIEADLFIDCTGFRSLLLGNAMDEPFNSYEDLLPNNSAWATQVPYTDKETQLTSYTDCHAIDNGWVWDIPLWSRIGKGYVYSDKFVSDDDALNEFKEHLKEKGLYNDDLKFKNIKMRVGIHERLWVKNCVAIGLSGGFIEPLESSGLFTVHEFLLKLVRQLQRSKEHYISEWDKDNFNYQCVKQFKGFADFVAMHYSGSHRDDTPYWRHVTKKSMDFTKDSNFTMQSNERFNSFHYGLNDSWAGMHCIMQGLNCAPTDIASLKGWCWGDWTDFEQHLRSAIQQLERKKSSWKESVKDCQSLVDFLAENYHN